MIKSTLGTVKLTKANYELCELLDCTKSDVDISVRATLYADLVAILYALMKQQGMEQALEMWYQATKAAIEERTNQHGQ